MPGWHPRARRDAVGIWARAVSQLGPLWRCDWWHRRAVPTAAGDAAPHPKNLQDGSLYPTESPKEATKPGAMRALVSPHAKCPLRPPKQQHPTPVVAGDPPWLVTPQLPVPSGCPLSERAARPSPSPGSCTEPPTPCCSLSPGAGVPGARRAGGAGLAGAQRPAAWGCGVWGECAAMPAGRKPR